MDIFPRPLGVVQYDITLLFQGIGAKQMLSATFACPKGRKTGTWVGITVK